MGGEVRGVRERGDLIRKLKVKNQKAKLQSKIQNDLLLKVIDIFCRILVVNRRYLVVSF